MDETTRTEQMYEYKITTHGRAAMAACMDLEKPLRITNIAFGSGKVEPGTELADVHELLCYVSPGAVANRRHEDDRLFLTLQYANVEHPEVTRAFLLSEFMVYVEDPDTGKNTDFLYGTLGDYRQPVPPANPAYPPSVFNLPLVVVLSSDINVSMQANAGLVTYDELSAAMDLLAIRKVDVTIPRDGWVMEEQGAYRYWLDVAVDGTEERMVPQITILPEGEETALKCGLCPRAETKPDRIRVRAVHVPERDIPASLVLLRDSTGLVVHLGGVDGLPVATKETPGLMCPGPGLLVDDKGVVSVDTAGEADMDEMLEELRRE